MKVPRSLAALAAPAAVLVTAVAGLAAPVTPTASAAVVDTCTTTDTCSYYLSDSWTASRATTAISVAGDSTATAVVGDWTGKGVDTVGTRTGRIYSLQSTNAVCAPTTTLAYGLATDQTLVGDWNGDGKDTLAVRRGNLYYLRNTLGSGQADKVISFGTAADQVYVGDWNGDGVDTLAIRRGNLFYIKNSISSGQADKVIAYGQASDEVLVGDWDGNGTDTLALRRGKTWYLRNDLQTGVAQTVLTYGRATDTAVVGDWNGDGKDTPGIFRGASTLFNCTTGSTSTYSAATSTTKAAKSTVSSSSTGTSTFHAGAIITDAEFFKPGTMSAAAIRSWLQAKNPYCKPGSDGASCLKDYTATTKTMDTAYCAQYTGAKGEDAATIIAKASSACGINPKVLLVLVQKEQGLVTDTGSALNKTRYAKATGFACPDNAACSATYAGFQTQIYYAASRFVQYGAQSWAFRYRAGGTYSIAYNPKSQCGSSKVTIANRATAALYNYTPYQPNAAALKNLTGTGDSCSSYGNRNFWRYYRSWFGTTGY